MIDRNPNANEVRTIISSLMGIKEEVIERYHWHTPYSRDGVSSITLFPSRCQDVFISKKPYYFMFVNWDRNKKIPVYNYLKVGLIPHDIFIDHETWVKVGRKLDKVMLPRDISNFIKVSIEATPENPGKVVDYLKKLFPNNFDPSIIEYEVEEDASDDAYDTDFNDIMEDENLKGGTDKSYSVFSQREYAALLLKQPTSGTDWLDKMIRESNK